ncbi:MAG: baseplate J/gp47 family protein [Chloroflexi bacterium]|nr:baseplate J/gp47 family protein [Chloroflexota bacterium]
MKTQIFTLESHDDLISIRDRLAWAKTPRILLVWPKGERIALRPLDLKVLQRQADALGAQLGLVTRRASVRREAEALGIPVFESSGTAQREAWPAREPRAPRAARPPRRDLRQLREQASPPETSWRSRLSVRVIAFGLGVLAVLAVAGLFIPRAKVILHPEVQTQSLEFPVLANPDIQSVFVTGSVPARAESIVVEGGKSAVVTSRIPVPQTSARGVARFRNLTPTEVEIPAGTVVYTFTDPPARFATLNGTRLTAGLDQIVEVPIEAVEAGQGGNVEAEAIQAIEGSLGLMATVSNPEATGGGSDTTAIGPTADDRFLLRERLTRELASQAEDELRGRLSADDLLLSDTLKVSQTLEETYNPPADKQGTTLALTLRLEFTVQVVSMQDLTELAEASLNAAAPQGFFPVADSLTFQSVSKPVTSAEGVTRWRMQAGRRLFRVVDTGAVQRLVLGRPLGQALALVADSQEFDSAPQVELTPDWWPWLPLIPFRVQVVIQ